MKFQETEAVELKRTLNKDFAKDVVAFLNTRDGMIYVGVEDNGDVVGIDNVDKTMRDIRDIIRDQILPSTVGLCEIGSLLEEDKTIIFVKITKGTKLYYIKKEGRSATGCFYRDGSSSTPMSEDEIEGRFVTTYFKHLDMVEVPSSQKEFSFTQLKIYYSSHGYHLNDGSLIDNLHLKTVDGKFNFLAELLSDKNRVSIKVARFKGEDKSVLLEKSEYGYQCLLVAIDRVINRLEAENITRSYIVGAQRVDKRLMDMSSLREIFINAIAHNDWTIVEPAVYIFSNHIEIISYGGLPEGETKEMFFKGISKPRNKELMRVLSDLNYVEQTGYGVPEILKHYGKDIFDIQDNYIDVSIPYDDDVMASIAIKNDEAISNNENIMSGYNGDEKLVGAENGAENGDEKLVGAENSDEKLVDAENGAENGDEKLVDAENGDEKSNDNEILNYEEKIILLIKNNPNISLPKISKELNVSKRVLERIIRNSKRIKHVGPAKGGQWLVEED